jgi:hypothetical protein
LYFRLIEKHFTRRNAGGENRFGIIHGNTRRFCVGWMFIGIGCWLSASVSCGSAVWLRLFGTVVKPLDVVTGGLIAADFSFECFLIFEQSLRGGARRVIKTWIQCAYSKH